MWMYYLNNIDFFELLLFMRWKMFYFVKNIFANEPFLDISQRFIKVYCFLIKDFIEKGEHEGQGNLRE